MLVDIHCATGYRSYIKRVIIRGQLWIHNIFIIKVFWELRFIVSMAIHVCIYKYVCIHVYYIIIIILSFSLFITNMRESVNYLVME